MKTSDPLRELKDALAVSAAIQSKHTQLLKEHAEMIHGLHTASNEHNRMLLAQTRAITAQSDAYLSVIENARQDEDRRRNTERALERLTLKVEEIGDKLNGLIGYISGQQKPPR